MIITLPDKSLTVLDCKSLRFRSVDTSEVYDTNGTDDGDSPFGINCELLASYLSNPQWKFGDCFRRISDHPRYSPKSSVHNFDVSLITSIYRFSGSYQGGTFSSSSTEWNFLDGGIISQNGYGWGSHSWAVIEGAEALRAICLFLGIKQPRAIKGEKTRRPLALLLHELSSAPLQEKNGKLWNLPEALNKNA